MTFSLLVTVVYSIDKSLVRKKNNVMLALKLYGVLFSQRKDLRKYK